jgi:chromosome segregation ATPase
MVKLFTILRSFWSSLISYLRPDQPKIKSGDDQTKEPVNECEQVRKQLQQTNTSLSILLFQAFTEYNQIDKQLNDTTTENESLKQAVRELQQQSETFERERNEAREVSTKRRLENTLLEQKIEQLESHKKVLIQELGGSLSGQDIELITWEFLIQEVKEVTNQLNEVIARNQSLIKTNRDLQQEKDVLRRELNQVKDNNTRLTQDNSQLRANKNSIESELRRTLDRIKPLERAKDKLEQEKAQLERKFSELNKVKSKLRQAEAQIEQLEEEVKELKQTKKPLEVELKQEKAKVTSLEQKTKDLEKAKNQLEIELKQEKSKTVPLEQKAKSLEQAKNQLDAELKQEKAKVTSLEQKTKDLEKAKNQLEIELKQEKSKTVPLEQKVKGLEQAKNQLDAELKQEKAKVAPIEQKNKSLEQVRNQLETALNQGKSRVAVLEREINNLRISQKEGENKCENTTDDKDKLLIEISKLNQTIKQLNERIKQLEQKSNQGSFEQEQECSNHYYNQPDTLDEIDLLELYNDLVYFVQKSLNCSGIEKLEDWGETEEFYVELISRLCFIDTILVTKIESLEDEFYLIPKENNNHGLAVTPSYPGKFLFWSNGEVRWELSSFFNSKL